MKAKPTEEKSVQFTIQCPNLYTYIKDATLINQCLFAFPHVNFFSLEFHVKELQWKYF